MKTNILLLAEIFEQVRNSCLKTYVLNPGHYFTLPGFTWDCMLNDINQAFELITELDPFDFVC